mgnify:CR=1 FL=1
MLKDEVDVDPNDQASVLEHLDKIVSFQFSMICYNLFHFIEKHGGMLVWNWFNIGLFARLLSV